jgi:hypothetical protein
MSLSWTVIKITYANRSNIWASGRETGIESTGFSIIIYSILALRRGAALASISGNSPITTRKQHRHTLQTELQVSNQSKSALDKDPIVVTRELTHCTASSHMQVRGQLRCSHMKC